MGKSGMRVVIDTNRLESDEIRLFLSGDPRNFAVLPEHTVVEIFKPSDVDAVISSFRVLRDYPRQVLLLRSNGKSALVDPRGGAIAERLIDRRVTRAFPKFCGMLKEAKAGHAGYRRQLAVRRKWALERAEAIQTSFGDQSDSLAELAAIFTQHELRQIRSGKPLSERVWQSMLEVVLGTATNIHTAHSGGKSLYPPPYTYDQFVWRYALCHIIQLMELVRKGAKRRAPGKARNDHFDNVFATYGTYFNGLMTNDRGPLLTQHIARMMLRALGARLAVDYVDSEYILSLIDENEEIGSKSE
jgi:hypothetical protein